MTAAETAPLAPAAAPLPQPYGDVTALKTSRLILDPVGPLPTAITASG